MQNYIDQKVEEFEKEFSWLGGMWPEDKINTYEEIENFFKDSLTDLLLKCKEAVGEEKKHRYFCKGDQFILQCTCGATHWNSCRSTTLQNLDNLK